MKKNLICINCPMGCELEVTYTNKKIIKVQGNTCKRGIQYAETEIFHPVRIVTTTVCVSGSGLPFVPVKTEKPVPKKLTSKIVKRACQITLHAPVNVGDIALENILNTGVNLVVTRSLPGINKKKPASKLKKPLSVKKNKQIRRKKRDA